MIAALYVLSELVNETCSPLVIFMINRSFCICHIFTLLSTQRLYFCYRQDTLVEINQKFVRFYDLLCKLIEQFPYEQNLIEQYIRLDKDDLQLSIQKSVDSIRQFIVHIVVYDGPPSRRPISSKFCDCQKITENKLKGIQVKNSIS